MEEIKGYSKDAIVRVSNKESSNLMTKNIIKIIENKEGDINPIVSS